MVIFRENTEDIYAGIEFAAGTPESQKVLDFLQQEFPKDFDKIRFGTSERKSPDFANKVADMGSDDNERQRRHRHQAGLQIGHHAPGLRRHRLRHQERFAFGDPGSQRQTS